jgi:hypothetical protein
VSLDEPWVGVVLGFYLGFKPEALANKTIEIRAGPAQTFDGANFFETPQILVIFVDEGISASGKSLALAHELNQGTHEQNSQAEETFLSFHETLEAQPRIVALSSKLKSANYETDLELQRNTLDIIEALLRQKGIIVTRGTLVNIADVLRGLLLSPVAKSEELCERYRLSADELVEVYRIMHSVSELHDMLIHQSEFAGVAGEIEYQLSQREYLESMFSEDKVTYPLIVEFHPGIWCTYACVFCYSRHDQKHPFRYQDFKMKRRPLTPERARELVRDLAQGGAKQVWVSGGE